MHFRTQINSKARRGWLAICLLIGLGGGLSPSQCAENDVKLMAGDHPLPPPHQQATEPEILPENPSRPQFISSATTRETESATDETKPVNRRDDDVLGIHLPAALLRTSDDLSNTNVHVHPHDNFKTARIDEFKHLLATAIRQRGQKLYDLAANNLESLLTGKAPHEIKREALLELAVLAEQQGHYGRAIQVYGQFQTYFEGDAIVPEIFLRQGLLYRRIGAPKLALSKFFAVLSSAVNLKSGNVEYFQQLVLQAQTEIADTYFQQGKLREAADAFLRLLEQENPGLNEAEIRYKLVRCRVGLGENAEIVETATAFLEKHDEETPAPEVRFILSNTLLQLGQNSAALEQLFYLLDSQQRQSDANPTNWVYWQQRTGNQIANQLYQEGDYLSALHIYNVLAELNTSPAWQLPVWYQIGLIYEKLEQPAKALEYYGKIADHQTEFIRLPAPAVKTVIDMARWRADFLNWQTAVKAAQSGQTNTQAKLSTAQPRSP